MKDRLSAMLDGDLDDGSCVPVLDRIGQDPELRSRWQAYCLIGDVLRGEASHDMDFASRVMADIDSEPTVLAPPAASPGGDANELRGMLMPIAASVMGILAVGWVAHTLYSQPQETSGFASAVAPVQVVEARLAPPLRQVTSETDDPHREYVFVHQAMNGGGPIPRVIQHVRTVSDALGDVSR